MLFYLWPRLHFKTGTFFLPSFHLHIKIIASAIQQVAAALPAKSRAELGTAQPTTGHRKTPAQPILKERPHKEADERRLACKQRHETPSSPFLFISSDRYENPPVLSVLCARTEKCSGLGEEGDGRRLKNVGEQREMETFCWTDHQNFVLLDDAASLP